MGIDESVIAIKKGLNDDGDRRIATRLAKRLNGIECRRLDFQLSRDSLLARNIDALEQQISMSGALRCVVTTARTPAFPSWTCQRPSAPPPPPPPPPP